MGLPFLASKRNSLINSFLWMLLLMVLWTGGSFLMRMQAFPGVKVWYDVSLFGLLLFPIGLLGFINHYIGKGVSAEIKIYALLLLAVNIVKIATGFFLKCPEVVPLENGDVTFVYHPTWTVIVLFVLCLLVVIRSLMQVIKASKFIPIIVGITALLVGNILIMFPPFIGIPLDILSGVIFASCLFYSMYMRHLFRLTLLISRSNCYALSSGIALFFLVNFFPEIEKLIQNSFPTVSSNILIAVLFTISVQVIFLILRSFIDHIFVREEILKAEQLKKFSTSVSKTLIIDEILSELISIISDTIATQKVYICLADSQANGFTIAGSSSCLDEKNFFLDNDNPIVHWLSDNSVCLILKEFRRTAAYRSMWEKEKDRMQALGIDCIIPLKGDDSLVGMIMLSEEKKKPLNQDDLNFLASVGVIASIAVKNSMLYERACVEARTDELTGLLNRKYFFEVLGKEFEKNKDNGCLTLIILNIDDFKLYNQLYGNKEGDIALQKIAKIILACTGNRGYVGRYSGKEFAIVLPMIDVLAAKNLAVTIKNEVMEMNKNSFGDSLMPLTLSIGICSVPYGATTLAQLISNVDMSVYQVKSRGKNAIMVYSAGTHLEEGRKINKQIRKENIYSGYESTIYALTAAIDTKDHYTFSHSKNVEYYSTCLARALNLNEDTVEIVRQAALLHDVGKIGVPEEILNKPDRLTEEEYEIVKGHVESSISIIRHLPSLDYVIPAVLGHHERYDGKGYPRRIAGEDIPLLARILCIADSFDAMISARIYKKAFTVGYALEELDKQAGKQFDPKLVKLFIELVNAGRIIPGESILVNAGEQTCAS
jgi:diguanylate cyclase (GGDEF)-like protein/putative nucleotidyltransferase with HDIG domain